VKKKSVCERERSMRYTKAGGKKRTISWSRNTEYIHMYSKEHISNSSQTIAATLEAMMRGNRSKGNPCMCVDLQMKKTWIKCQGCLCHSCIGPDGCETGLLSPLGVRCTQAVVICMHRRAISPAKIEHFRHGCAIGTWRISSLMAGLSASSTPRTFLPRISSSTR
jgi:hypothetical protein